MVRDAINRHREHLSLRPERTQSIAPQAATRPPRQARPACRHLGTPTGELRDCPSCGGKTVKLKVLGCGVHGSFTPGRAVEGVAHCGSCQQYERPVGPAPLARHRIDPSRLGNAPHSLGARFNGGIIRYQGRLLLAYRIGWEGSHVWLAELDEEYRPIWNLTLLGLYHPAAIHGREDPRLFVYRGRLHVSYHGVMGEHGPTNVLYARLTDDFRVQQVYHPHIPERQTWEKSHVYFEGADGELYMVYSVAPAHRVYRVRGEVVELVGGTPNALPWSGGERRGGASPVYHDGRWWHGFHGRIGAWSYGTYTLGVYTFEATAPFRVLQSSPHPLLTGDHANRQKWQKDDFPAAIWPAGAVLENGIWKLGYGLQDHWCEVGEWDAASVDRFLVSPTNVG
jgi:predicted GH43/DUF377 family glycosyl hydrolase